MREVYNELSVEQQNSDRIFSLSYRFISGPSAPVPFRQPGQGVIVLIVIFLAGFFFVCLALILHWRKSSKQALQSSAPKS